MTRFMQGHLTSLKVNSEHVRGPTNTCHHRSFPRQEWVPLSPRQNKLLVGFFKNDRMKRVAVGVLEKSMRLNDSFDLVQLRDGQGVEWVAGDGGGVVAKFEVGGGGGGVLKKMWVFFGLDAVLGDAPWRIGGAVERV
ncbi:hypothetical protein ACH5RR_038583 [Cinchona calisaya]|uniref:Uncharacterized protein n=1 Tax=Cinchona calisaya TaxID=153742 RepID=A0ABD2XYT8_9GENT